MAAVMVLIGMMGQQLVTKLLLAAQPRTAAKPLTVGQPLAVIMAPAREQGPAMLVMKEAYAVPVAARLVRALMPLMVPWLASRGRLGRRERRGRRRRSRRERWRRGPARRGETKRLPFSC
jgi:hypothetical protein